jgi:uncharacterized membrane protein YcaP (DUF421 family)
MNPWRIVIRVVFAYLFALALVRVSGKRTVQQADVQSFVLALVLGDMVDDFFWAEVSAAQFVIGVGALLLTHVWTALTAASSGRRNWRREELEALR